MPIQISLFPFLTPPPAKSQTSPRICYGFLTNPPRNHKSRQPLELTPTVAKLKVAMDRVKDAYAEKKKTLKGYYPQERWMDYGVPDKR